MHKRGWPILQRLTWFEKCSVLSLSQQNPSFFSVVKSNTVVEKMFCFIIPCNYLNSFFKILFWLVHDHFVPNYCRICLLEFDLALAHLHIQSKTKFPQKIRDGTIRLFSETAVYLTSTCRQILNFISRIWLCAFFRSVQAKKRLQGEKLFFLGLGTENDAEGKKVVMDTSCKQCWKSCMQFQHFNSPPKCAKHNKPGYNGLQWAAAPCSAWRRRTYSPL